MHSMDSTISPATKVTTEVGFKYISTRDDEKVASEFEAAMSKHPRLKMLQAEKADLTSMKKAARTLWGVSGAWYLGRARSL